MEEESSLLEPQASQERLKGLRFSCLNHSVKSTLSQGGCSVPSGRALGPPGQGCRPKAQIKAFSRQGGCAKDLIHVCFVSVPRPLLSLAHCFVSDTVLVLSKYGLVYNRHNNWYSCYPVLQVRKLRHSMVKQLAQSCTPSIVAWDWSPGRWALGPLPLTTWFPSLPSVSGSHHF